MKNYRLTCHTGEEVPDSLRSDEKPYGFARTGVLYLFVRSCSNGVALLGERGGLCCTRERIYGRMLCGGRGRAEHKCMLMWDLCVTNESFSAPKTERKCTKCN